MFETADMQAQHDLLRDMIDKQLLLSRGKELGINADSEVIRRLDEIAAAIRQVSVLTFDTTTNYSNLERLKKTVAGAERGFFR